MSNKICEFTNKYNNEYYYIHIPVTM